MKKNRKFLKKGLSFLMVLVLAFTSVFFNSTPTKATVEPDKTSSGVYLGMTLVDITGGGYYEQAGNYLELTKGEEYTLKVGLGYQDEDSPGGFKKTKIKENSVYVHRNKIQKKSFPAFKTGPKNREKEYVNVQFKAGEGSDIDSSNGKATDFIEVKGKTGGFGIGIYLSSYLIYNLKLKADFYYEGADTPYDRQLVSWNSKVEEIKHEDRKGYEFKGWYYRDNPDKKFNFDETITDNVELVAKYEKENNDDQDEKVTVNFIAEDRTIDNDDSCKVDKGSTFKQAKAEKQDAFNLAEETAKKYNAKNTFLNVEKYDWYTDAQYNTIANDDEQIDKDKTYYGQLKKDKVNVTFFVDDTKNETVTIEKGNTFTDAKKLLKTFNDFDKYDWYTKADFQNEVNENEKINENTTYHGKLKTEEVDVIFYVDKTNYEIITIEKGQTFTDANNAAVKNGFDTSKYEWYQEPDFKNLADDDEKIDKDKTYYGQLKKDKVNVTFFVDNTKQETVTIEKGNTFTDAKGLLNNFSDFEKYDWYNEPDFKTKVADENEKIDEKKTYYGKSKTSGDNGNNGNNGDNGNNGGNNNNGDNGNNGGNNNNGDNGNNGGNNNNGDNGNNGNNTTPTIPTTPTTPTTPIVATEPTVPESNITIPDDTTPLSPAPAEVSTTPTTESEDNNENIDIEDDDTALGTAVMDKDNDVDEAEDVAVPVKTKKKVVAKKEKSLDINADDTPLGTTLPKTGGSFGLIYILFGLLLSAFGIKKFREK